MKMQDREPFRQVTAPFDYKKWECAFWKDRDRVRENPLRRFSIHFDEVQMQLINRSNQVNAICKGFSSYPQIKSSAYQLQSFAEILSFLVHQIQIGEAEPILQVLDSPRYVNILVRISRRLEDPSLESTRELQALLGTLPSKVRLLVANMARNLIASRRARFTGSFSHTEVRRQQDGNMLLSTLPYFIRRAAEPRIALFGGGSIGLTALAFRSTLPSHTRASWHIINSDLYSPTDIWRRNKHRNVAQKSSFSRPPELKYLQADLTCLPFKPRSVDFLDACNCLWMENPGERLDAVLNAWRLLKVGGYYRTTPGHYSSLFEELIVRKTGLGIKDWKLVHINVVGKTFQKLTGELADPKKALAIGKRITQDVITIRSRLKRKHFSSSSDFQPEWGDPVSCLLHDLYLLSPFTFGASIPDDLFLWFGNAYGWFKNPKDLADMELEVRDYEERKRILLGALRGASQRIQS